MTKTSKPENGADEQYQGGFIDGLISQVNAVVPEAIPQQPTWNGLLLTIDEVLERIKRGGQ